MLTLPWPCSRDPSPVCLARTTRSTPRCLSPASPARVRWTEVTTRTPRPSARRSTSARLMVPEVSPSTASSAPTEPSSTRTTSSATGGSTSTAQLPKTSTPSTTRSPQRGRPWQATAWEPTEGNLSTELPQSTPEMLPSTRQERLLGGEEAGGSEEAGGTAGEARKQNCTEKKRRALTMELKHGTESKDW